MPKTISEVLAEARAAAEARTLQIFEMQGKQDCGCCGGAIMYLKGNTKLAKVAVAEGYAYGTGGDISVKSFVGEGVRTQNIDVWQGAIIAFRDVLIANGYGKAIKKFWTYID